MSCPRCPHCAQARAARTDPAIVAALYAAHDADPDAGTPPPMDPDALDDPDVLAALDALDDDPAIADALDALDALDDDDALTGAR